MQASNAKKILFIGDDIETRIVFGNALSSLLNEPSVHFFFNVDTACRYLSLETAQQPDIIFVNAGKNSESWLAEINRLKNATANHHCEIVVYDTLSVFTETDKIQATGAYNFVSKPYDFARLKKLLRTVVAPENKETRSRNLSMSTYDF